MKKLIACLILALAALSVSCSNQDLIEDTQPETEESTAGNTKAEDPYATAIPQQNDGD